MAELFIKKTRARHVTIKRDRRVQTKICSGVILIVIDRGTLSGKTEGWFDDHEW